MLLLRSPYLRWDVFNTRLKYCSIYPKMYLQYSFSKSLICLKLLRRHSLGVVLLEIFIFN